MGTETLAGQRHRRGLLWVITGLGCGRSQVQIPGEPPFLKVSVSNEIGYKHEVGLGLRVPGVITQAGPPGPKRVPHGRPIKQTTTQTLKDKISFSVS